MIDEVIFDSAKRKLAYPSALQYPQSQEVLPKFILGVHFRPVVSDHTLRLHLEDQQRMHQ